MEFNFNINNLIGDEISVFDRDVRPHRRNADGFDSGGLQAQLLQVIDRMGEASSRAQGLHTIITTGRKLQISDHILYIKKDAAAYNGKGSVVGILRIGCKKLFVYNHYGVVHEMEPMCVLDFYVHESRQRMGCGRHLFDTMLRDQNIQAHQLAIDKPSFKFSQFLAKHYNLNAEIPQVNNFAVFEGFFNNKSRNGTASGGQRRAPSVGYSRPPSHPSRRKERRAYTFVPGRRYYTMEDTNGYRPQINGYSPSPFNQLPPLAPTGSRPSSGKQNMNPSSSPSALQRDTQLDYPRNGQLNPISNDPKDDRVHGDVKSLTPRGMMPKQTYSRHSNSASPPARYPNNDHKSMTGWARDNPKAEPANTIPADFLQNLNLHQDYQGRRGHMRVDSGGSQTRQANPILLDEDRREKPVWRQPSDQQNWTVFNKEQGYLAIASRNYTHTRLW